MEKIISNNQEQKMSSREISQLTGKRHDHVLRDIDNLNVKYTEMGLPKIGDTPYTNPQNSQTYRECFLDKMQTLDLMTGYSIEMRIKVNRRWQELENYVNSEEYIISRGYMLAVKKVEYLEATVAQQSNELKVQAPKAKYYDEVLSSTSTYSITLIAKELGFTAVELNKKLYGMGIQFKQHGTWVLYAKYQNKGFTKTTTHEFTSSTGVKHTRMQTEWTEKGREFIHGLFNQQQSA